MKICIVSAVNIKHMSMVTFYSEFLRKKNINFDLIYFDKYDIEETLGENKKFVYKNRFSSKTSKLKKVLEYYKFKNYAKKILLQNNYDFVIVWNDLAIHLLGRFLSKKFKGKYCLNIRDYFGQDLKIISSNTLKAIKNSAFNTISSEGYMNFLPPAKYYVMHSINENVKNDLKKIKSERKNYPVRITFVGNVRFFDQNQKILEIFKNNDDFILQYFGTNANRLKTYCEMNNILNTKFHDSFDLENTSAFVNDGDLVNNLYGNNSKKLDYSISIKLYHSVIVRQPIIVLDNTFIAELVKQYKIGLVVDCIDESLPQKIKHFYDNLDIMEYNNACKKFIEISQSQNEVIKNQLTKILEKELSIEGVVL